MADKLPGLHLGAQRAAYLAARVARVQLVDHIAERRQVGVAAGGVHAVVDCDQPHAHLREYDLQIAAALQIVAPEAREILDENEVDTFFADLAQHFLKLRPVEARA